MLATNQRIWGYETNYGGLGEIARRQGQPADAEARPPHLGGGGGQRAHQLHQLPDAREPERRADDPGPDRARSGARAAASARTRASTCSTAAARRSAWCRRPSGRRCCTRWASSTSSTARPRATSSGPTSTTQDPARVAPARQEDPRARWASTPTSCSSTRVARRWARRCSCAQRGGQIITCAATSGFMIEYDNRYLWMNQKTLKGCHFANYREAWEANRLVVRGRRSTRRCRRCSRSSRPARRRSRCTRTCTRASSACSCLAPEEGLGVTEPGDAREQHPRPDHAVPSPPVAIGMNPMSDSVLTEIDHVAIAVQRPRRRGRVLPRHLRRRGRAPRGGRARRRRGGAAAGGRLLRAAAHPDPRRLAGREVAREEGRGHPPRRLPGRRLRRGARAGEGPGPPGDRRRAPPREPGHHGRVHPPEERRSAP